MSAVSGPLGAADRSERLPRASRLRVWSAGLAIGFRSLRREPALAVKRLVLPVSYWRLAEFAYTWSRLRPVEGMRILDVGSPKELAQMLARRAGCEVVATDILETAVHLSRRYAVAQGIDGAGAGRVLSEVQDGRALTYADASFDAAYSVSVLEHIPDAGDSAAIRELVRVVRPGGAVIVTLPYDRAYRETFVDRPVYERAQTAGAPVFFERHYSEEALRQRLVEPSGARLLDLQIWGEGAVRMEELLTRIGPLRALASPAEPLLSLAFLRRLVPDAGREHPMAAFLTLEKP